MQKLNTLFPLDNDKPALKKILDVYQRQLIFSSVQVVAPLTQVAIESNPGRVEDWAHIGSAGAATSTAESV